MKPKARIGDYVRIIRPRGHRLGADAPVGEVIRVAGVSYIRGRRFYRSARSTDLWRSDELELLCASAGRGRPSKRQLRNRRFLERISNSKPTAAPMAAATTSKGGGQW